MEQMYMWLMIFIPIFIVLFSNDSNQKKRTQQHNKSICHKELTAEVQKQYAVARLAYVLNQLSDEKNT